MKTRFEIAYKTAKKLLTEKTDVDIIIARYMFEKFGTLPEEVVEMDEYQKGIVLVFLEDIVNVHNEQVKRQNIAARTHRRRR